MSTLERLKNARVLNDLADILGFKSKSLSYILYKIQPKDKYTQFEIPKKSGGTRVIHSPEKRLKKLQKHLANILYQILQEIDKSYEVEHRKKPRKVSHGFSKGLSIVTNAASHRNHRYVLNLDLLDFFPSINFGRVRGVFIKDKRFEFNEKIATLIAQIACREGILPQGSPCSPVISNIVGNILDVRLVRLAKEFKCTYSRYADDITFSTNSKEFPKQLAFQQTGNPDKWEIGANLSSEISNSGFEINKVKTRMQYRNSRQITTGLLVNKKVNVKPEYYRTVRAMCSSFFNTGQYHLPISKTIPNEATQYFTKPNILHGRLDFIYHVKRYQDKKNKYHANKSQDEKNIKMEKSSTLEKTMAIEKLYRNFLIFINFVNIEKPVIITEGKTDIIYLKTALKKLSKFHPQLGSFKNEYFCHELKYFNIMSKINNTVLNFTGGSGQLKNFIAKYRTELKNFKYKPLKCPVIILVDNDDGASKIFSTAKECSTDKNIDISHTADKDFYFIYDNLYLIKTPEPKGKTKNLYFVKKSKNEEIKRKKDNTFSCIESLFSEELLQTKLDGKIFELISHDGKSTYSKIIFAQKVILPNVKTIDFNEFSKLFDRIVAVIDDYNKRIASPPT